MEKEYTVNTRIGMITINKKIINNVPTLSVIFENKIQFVIKQLLNKKEFMSHANAVIHYDNTSDLSKVLYTSNVEDAMNASESKYSKVIAFPYDLRTISFKEISESETEELFKFIKADVKERIVMLESRKDTENINKIREEVKSTINISEKAKMDTIFGPLTFERNNEHFPNGITIKLNGAPIVLIEQFKDEDGKEKLVLKRYPNKNVINNDDYFNMESYGIQIEDLDFETIHSILKDIKE